MLLFTLVCYYFKGTCVKASFLLGKCWYIRGCLSKEFSSHQHACKQTHSIIVTNAIVWRSQGKEPTSYSTCFYAPCLLIGPARLMMLPRLAITQVTAEVSICTCVPPSSGTPSSVLCASDSRAGRFLPSFKGLFQSREKKEGLGRGVRRWDKGGVSDKKSRISQNSPFKPPRHQDKTFKESSLFFFFQRVSVYFSSSQSETTLSHFWTLPSVHTQPCIVPAAHHWKPMLAPSSRHNPVISKCKIGFSNTVEAGAGTGAADPSNWNLQWVRGMHECWIDVIKCVQTNFL